MLKLEALESRDNTSVSVVLAGTNLVVKADNDGSKVVVTTPDVNTVRVNVVDEQKVYDFATSQVMSLTYNGGNSTKPEYFANKTSLPSVQNAGIGRGLHYLEGGTGTDALVGSPNIYSSNYLFDTSGPANSVVGGKGYNNIQVFGSSNSITAGPRGNLVYAILGSNTINGYNGYGDIITNAISTVTNAKRQHTVTFFQASLANQVAVVQKGVLYLNPQASGVTFVVDEVGTKLVVTYTETGGVPTKFTFNKRDVNWIASFGSSGDDTYINNTSKKVVQYGAGGNDQIIGGFGLNLLKGSSGDDIIVGRGTYNDLTANSGNDIIISKGKVNVIRPDTTSVSTKVVTFNKNADIILGNDPLSILG